MFDKNSFFIIKNINRLKIMFKNQLKKKQNETIYIIIAKNDKKFSFRRLLKVQEARLRCS